MAFTISNKTIRYPEPSPTFAEMLQQISDARAAIENSMGISSARLSDPQQPMTVTEIMFKLEAERSQQVHSPRIVESIHATEPAEDWSRVRSPSRARRRRHKHRQNIRPWRKPAAFMINGVLHVHPEILRQLRALGGRA